MRFDLSSGRVIQANFAGSGHELWIDDLGNLELRCHFPDSQHDLALHVSVIAAMQRLTYAGKKSLRFYRESEELDGVVPLDGVPGEAEPLGFYELERYLVPTWQRRQGN